MFDDHLGIAIVGIDEKSISLVRLRADIKLNIAIGIGIGGQCVTVLFARVAGRRRIEIDKHFGGNIEPFFPTVKSAQYLYANFYLNSQRTGQFSLEVERITGELIAAKFPV